MIGPQDAYPYDTLLSFAAAWGMVGSRIPRKHRWRALPLCAVGALPLMFLPPTPSAIGAFLVLGTLGVVALAWPRETTWRVCLLVAAVAIIAARIHSASAT